MAPALSRPLLEGIADAAPGPAARYEAKESVALAFVSGLQHLAPRQRAVLVLRDVLGFHADEVADMLGSARPRSTARCSGRGGRWRRAAARRERLAMPLTRRRARWSSASPRPSSATTSTGWSRC